MSRSNILVSIVTRNDATVLSGCLESLARQTVSHRIKILDNASQDETRLLARRADVALNCSERNLGFSRGHNLNLLDESFDFALVLNADTELAPDFLEQLLNSVERADRIGMIGGKLLRLQATASGVMRPLTHQVLDSTGIYFTPTQRHFDRGSNEPDVGQYERRQFVFGITGAAVLLRREMLEDVRWKDEYFDEDFFAYREDADLSWRAQLLGWRALYEPAAIAWHLRQVLPIHRHTVDPLVNYHSVKNRFLMRIKNMDWGVRSRCLPYMYLRDAAAFSYMLIRERTSLAALQEVSRLKPRMLEKREHTLLRRRSSPREVGSWFSFRPRAVDLDAVVGE